VATVAVPLLASRPSSRSHSSLRQSPFLLLLYTYTHSYSSVVANALSPFLLLLFLLPLPYSLSLPSSDRARERREGAIRALELEGPPSLPNVFPSPLSSPVLLLSCMNCCRDYERAAAMGMLSDGGRDEGLSPARSRHSRWSEQGPRLDALRSHVCGRGGGGSEGGRGSLGGDRRSKVLFSLLLVVCAWLAESPPLPVPFPGIASPWHHCRRPATPGRRRRAAV